MGYIIKENGEKIEVNNPDGFCTEEVVLVNDDTILKDKYILELYKKEYNSDKSEFVKEIEFDTIPTDEKIIFHMTKNGISRYSGYAQINKIKVIDFKDE